MLIGGFGPGSLESSYQAAFASLDFAVTTFDIDQSIRRYCRFGRIGQVFNDFVPVDPWARKANRDLVAATSSLQPDFVVSFGHYPIMPGALAEIRSTTRASLVHVWPDTLLNLNINLISSLPLFDLVASYSASGRKQLERLGAKNVEWIPLAGDPKLHQVLEVDNSERLQYGADVTFIGGWRPEREAVLTQLDSFDVKIWGPDWGRRCRNNKSLLRRWQGRALYGSAFAKAVCSSKINLNIIDPLNYPAANMRFFEIPVAGGLQVCSSCPEMDEQFIHGKHIFYYHDGSELKQLITSLINDEPLCNTVAAAAHAKVLTAHTYTERVRSILMYLEKEQPCQ